MPLTGVYGSGGSGKTLIVMYMLYQWHKELQKYGNFNCLLPNWEKKSTLELFELPETEEKTAVVYDEAYTEMDNRLSMTEENRINSYLLFQARKNNMSMISISQLNVLDIRWRGLEKFAIYCKDRAIYDRKGEDCKDDFKYVFTNGNSFSSFTLKYRIAKKIFPLYRTKDKIFPKDFDDIKMRLKAKNPKERNQIVDEIVKTIEEKCTIPEDKREITHDFIKNAMMDCEMQLTFEPFVYIRLRNRKKEGD